MEETNARKQTERFELPGVELGLELSRSTPSEAPAPWAVLGAIDLQAYELSLGGGSTSPCVTPKFKQEAVRRIVDGGHSVAEISARTGVSAHSLYKWIEAVIPDKSEQLVAELTEAKSDILRLHAGDLLSIDGRRHPPRRHRKPEAGRLKRSQTGYATGIECSVASFTHPPET